MTQHQPRVLIVDDEADMRWVLRGAFEDAGFLVAEASDGQEALDHFGDFDPEVVLTDVSMPGMDGRELLRQTKAHNPDLAVILLTALEDIDTAVGAMKEGAFDYFQKPFDSDKLLLSARRASEQHNLRLEVERLKGELNGQQRIGFGPSPEADELSRRIDLLARQDAVAVLIAGESGTGKEVVARQIHRRSKHPAGPFVAVDCGALPEQLMESQLFGHKKGAFTGADRDRQGLFEMAHGGTLFLDEMGNLPLSLQAKLLRCLQERVVIPVGGGDPRPFRVRLLAASNSDLMKAIDDGEFRLDLYHRVAEFELKIPPLRERPQDILHFASWFLAEANKDMARQVRSFTEHAEGALLKHPWPGNLRELRNVVRRAVVISHGMQLCQADLQLTERPADDGSPESMLAELAESAAEGGTLTERVRRAKDALERQILSQALGEAQGNKAAAARSLGIDYTTMHRKLKKHGLWTMADPP